MLAWALLAVAGVAPGAAQEVRPEPGYLDDRSTPEAGIRSYYDAVNNREYARAYSYWEPTAAQRELAPFEDFAQGFADTASMEVTLGAVATDVGAGQLYFTVPISLVASLSDGSSQMFAGCFTLHLARPQLQAVPPFRPMAIQHANIIAVDDGQPDVSSSAFCDHDRGSSVPRPTAIWRDGQGFLRMDDAFGISAHHVKDYTAVRRVSHG